MQEAQNEVNGWEGATREVNTPATRLLSRPAIARFRHPHHGCATTSQEQCPAQDWECADRFYSVEVIAGGVPRKVNQGTLQERACLAIRLLRFV